MAKVVTNERGDISLVNPDSGEQSWAPRDQAQEAISAGFVLETSEQAQSRMQAQELDDPALAAMTGLGSALTFGLGPAAAVESGLMDAGALKSLKEQSPVAYHGADVVGTLGSVLLGVGAPATLARGAAKLGTKAAAKMGGGRAAGTAGKIGAFAAEGGAVGAGKAAERHTEEGGELLSTEGAKAMAEGAKIGVGTSLLLGVGGTVAIAAAKKTGKAALHLIDRKGIAKMRQMDTLKRAAEVDAADYAARAEMGASHLGKAEAGEQIAGQRVQAAEQTLSDMMPRPAVKPGVDAGQFADEMRAAAAADPMGSLRSLQAAEAAAAKADDTLAATLIKKRDSLTKPGAEDPRIPRWKGWLDKNTQLRKDLKAKAQAGTATDDDIARLESLAAQWDKTNNLISRARARADIDAPVLGKLDDIIAKEQSRIGAMRRSVDDTRMAMGMEAGETASQRMARIKVAQQELAAAKSSLKDATGRTFTVRKHLTDLHAQSAKYSSAAEKIGSDIAGEYGNVWSNAARISSIIAARATGMPVMGAGMGFGLMAAGASPATLLAGYAIPRAAAAFGKWSAEAMRGGTFQAAMKGAGKVWSEGISPGVRQQIAKTASAADYDKVKEQLSAFSPELAQQGVAQAIADGADPVAASEAAKSVAASNAHLREALPKSPTGSDTYKPTEREMRDWSTKASVAADPTRFAQMVMAGDKYGVRISTGTMQEVHPEFLDQMRREIKRTVQRANITKTKLDPDIAEMMAAVTGDKTLVPPTRSAEFVHKVQAAMAAQQPPKGMERGVGGEVGRRETTSDRLMKR